MTRVYFNVREPATYHADAVRSLRPVGYIMGEVLDSSDSRHIGTAAFGRRVKSYLSVIGHWIDVWEIGNEVTGRYSTVVAKLTTAYQDVTSAG